MCNPTSKKFCLDNECEICLYKTFACHPRSQYWSNKNIKTPREISKGTEQKYLFECDVCTHEFEMRIDCITGQNQWCSYCAGKKLCPDNCDVCFERSFASEEKSKYWSPENPITPRLVFKHSSKKYSFICEHRHKFIARVEGVAKGSVWCKSCNLTTEDILYKKFTEYGYSVEKQVKFDWCKNPKTNFKLPFDFIIDEYKLIIELDGGQHFKQVWNWQSPTEQQSRDIFKMKCANKHGYSVIRLLQEDVYRRCDTQFDILEQHIYKYDEPTNVYISSGDEYTPYKEKM